jgi:hypothetical protein
VSLPPSDSHHASHGTTVETQGTPAASAALETGTTTSGVEVASRRSTLELISSWATIAEVAGHRLRVLRNHDVTV